jgi:hypothetical protein
MDNKKAFTLINGGKAFFFFIIIVTRAFFQVIINSITVEKTF